jgi:glycosyltransferase involved in cell wall biosynthesis
MQPMTVVIGTRNRGDSVVRTVSTIVASDHPSWALHLVDQSHDERTARAIAPLLSDRRIHHHRSRTVGVATARNVGIAEATTELVAITDDDCEVASDWLAEIERAFELDPRIAIVFGNVLAGPHDSHAGFMPAYQTYEPVLARSLRDKNRIQGVGASMAIRRSCWLALGGFDETLGAGARLRSAEETDLTIRALRAGWLVYETPRVRVTHHGFYPWALHGTVMARYWYGTGAAFARSFAAHPVAIGGVLVELAGRWAVGTSGVALSPGARPHRLARLAAFARGFVAGLVAPRRPATAAAALKRAAA